jgi:hypothetical protein
VASVILMQALAPSYAIAAPYEGRVETVEHGSQPQFPHEYLAPGMIANDAMPDELAGKWYGNVEVAQLETYPQLHAAHPYWSQFVDGVSNFFHLKQTGQLMLQFKRQKNGIVTLLNSDVWMKGGARLQLTSGKGSAVVRGGFNLPTTVADKVRTKPGVVDQTRIDEVSIVDRDGHQVQHGFSEISAHYALVSPRKMSVKLLEIDYDEAHKPLWKVLIRGTATR